MDDLTTSNTTDMSSPLLDKLAPETRILIYEYVLSFDVPIKHTTNMQPFLWKLTGAKSHSAGDSVEEDNESDWESIDGEDESKIRSTEADLESAPALEQSEITQSLHHVNTSILTVSKLVYREAIAVFYKTNTVKVDPQLCDYEAFQAPRATDLSLATRIVAEIDIDNVEYDSYEFWTAVDACLTAIQQLHPVVHTSN
jgi:hypothetical protein